MIVPLILSHHSLNILDGERGRAPPRLWKSIIARNTMFPCIPEERGAAPWPRARCSRLHISSLPVFTPAEMTLVGKIGFSSLSLWLRFTEYGAHKYKVTKYFLIFTNMSKIFFFKLWCCRRFLRVPWTPRRSNWSILKDIKLEYSLEGLMLKLQYFGHQMRRVDSLEKMLILWKKRQEQRRTTEDEMVGWHHPLNGHELQQVPGDGEVQRSLACCSPWDSKELGSTEQLNNNSKY